MDGLTALERAVLSKLLEGEHPVLAALREQAAQVHVARRETTAAGFFCDLETPETAAQTVRTTFTLDDVEAEIEGTTKGASFVLIVKKGRMTLLEGFTRDEPWPAQISAFTLRFANEPRDLGALD